MIISGIVASNAEKILTCGALVMIVVAIHNVVGLVLGTGAAKALKLDEKKVTAIGIEVGMQNSALAISGTIYAGIRNRKSVSAGRLAAGSVQDELGA